MCPLLYLGKQALIRCALYIFYSTKGGVTHVNIHEGMATFTFTQECQTDTVAPNLVLLLYSNVLIPVVKPTNIKHKI